MDITEIIIIVAIVIVGVLLFFKIDSFMRDMKYINGEIKRTRGEENAHWQRQKKRLWLTLVPFYSIFSGKLKR